MVVITGMHRSGTSVVAQICARCGVPMGDEQTLIRGDRWNADGYFEQKEVVEINRALVHGRWGRLSYLRLPSPRTIVARAEVLSSRIREAGRRYDSGFVKDPRFCLTLGAWLRHGARISGCVICIRHPQAVAESLRRRNKIPFALGYRLWSEHLERLQGMVEGTSSAWLVNYHTLMDPDSRISEVTGLLAHLGAPVEVAQLPRLLTQVVKADFDHFEATARKDDALPEHVRRRWLSLLAAHREQHGR